MSDSIWERLAAPFPADKIHWRIGQKTKDGSRAMVLAYIDARDVQDRLDEVLGPDGWQCRHTVEGGAYLCHLGLREWNMGTYTPEFLWKSNGAEETKVEAKKGGLSDAFKRAAVMWGVGRYLYDLPTSWVELSRDGKFTPPSLPEWALPGGSVSRPVAPLSSETRDTASEPRVDPGASQSHPEPSGEDLWEDDPGYGFQDPDFDPERAAIQSVEREEQAAYSEPHTKKLPSSGTSYWDVTKPECMFNAIVRPALPDDWQPGLHVAWTEDPLPTFPFNRGKMQADYGGMNWRYMTEGSKGGKRYETLKWIIECMSPPDRQRAGKFYQKNLAEHETLIARCKAAMILIEEGVPF